MTVPPVCVGSFEAATGIVANVVLAHVCPQTQKPRQGGVSVFSVQLDQPLAFSLARRSQVSTTVSGFSDTDSMPSCMSHSARSG